MPNWCEGSIKIRGKFENVKLFCKEVFRVYSFKKLRMDWKMFWMSPL